MTKKYSEHHEDGIYFGMPDEEYHADQSLSCSGIKDILADPLLFWYKRPWLNPDAPKIEPTDAMKRGTLWHTRYLEPTLFEERYAKEITPDELREQGMVPLFNATQIKEHLDDLGIEGYKKSAAVGELASLVAMHDPNAVYFPDAAREHAEMNDGKEIIKSDEWNVLHMAKSMYDAHPKFKDIFANGYSEVSIFWTDPATGTKLKGRIDYFKKTSSLDFKTISVMMGKSMDDAVNNDIKYRHYDLQSVMYTIGREILTAKIRNGEAKVFGDVDPEFIKEVLSYTKPTPFAFVFQQTQPPCAIRGKSIPKEDSDMFDAYGNGLYLFREGINRFVQFSNRYGKEPWMDPRGITALRPDEIYYGNAPVSEMIE